MNRVLRAQVGLLALLAGAALASLHSWQAGLGAALVLGGANAWFFEKNFSKAEERVPALALLAVFFLAGLGFAANAFFQENIAFLLPAWWAALFAVYYAARFLVFPKTVSGIARSWTNGFAVVEFEPSLAHSIQGLKAVRCEKQVRVGESVRVRLKLFSEEVVLPD